MIEIYRLAHDPKIHTIVAVSRQLALIHMASMYFDNGEYNVKTTAKYAFGSGLQKNVIDISYQINGLIRQQKP